MNKRWTIMTVGKTHSGKTTFARDLEQQLPNSVVIDRDDHAAFINAHYRSLLPAEGPNTLKSALTKTIVDYAVEITQHHLILCNAYRNQKDRVNLLQHFHDKGMTSVLVSFELPDDILRERIAASTRSKTVFRTAKSFEEVLDRQNAQLDVKVPEEQEAHHLFIVKQPEDVKRVIQNILELIG